MNNTLQKTFMELLELIDSYTKKASEYSNTIASKSYPTEIFDMLEDLQKDSVILDGAISKMESDIRFMKPEIIALLSRMRQKHTTMMTQIHERENMEVPVNTSGIIYDENHTFKDIIVSVSRMQTMDEVMIRDITIDELIDPKEYSTLSIINKLAMFNTSIDVLMGAFSREYAYLCDLFKRFKVYLLDLREVVNSGDCMDALSSSTWTDEAKGFKARISKAFNSSLVSVRKDMILLFQILTAMEDDMEIFEKVVNQYSAITTESFFNPDSIYTIL